MSSTALDAGLIARSRRKSTPKSHFRGDIQGLRAVAVLLVVIYHSGVSFFSGGYVGVDVFFVISGFLITTHLLEALDRDSRISFMEFYGNRVRRIMPAAFVVLIMTVGASLVWVPPMQLKTTLQAAIATVFYAPNMFFALKQTNYLAATDPSVFQHYWSLGIEEQFYAFWPLFIGAGFWIVRKSEKALFWLVAVLVTASFVLCLIMMGLSQPWTFFSLPTRAWELGVGGLVAFLLRSGQRWLAHRWTGALTWFGIVGLLTAAIVFDEQTPFPSFYATLPVFATAIIIIGGGAPSQLNATAVLSVRPLQFIGLISYSLYLVHWPLLVIPQAVAGLNNVLPLGVTVALGLTSIPLAYLLYRFVENPFRRARVLVGFQPRRSILAAAVTSVLIAGLTGGALVLNEKRPLDSGEAAPVSALSVIPAATPFVPSNLTPTLRSSSRDTPAIYSNGCNRDHASTDGSGCLFGDNAAAPRLALFGDSHAANWFPALLKLAESGAIRLDSNTKDACPSVSLETSYKGVVYDACQEWRESVISRLEANPPDLVLLANYGHYSANTFTSTQGTLSDVWSQGLKETIARLGSKTVVTVIADVPDMGASPASCLSAHLDHTDKCARPVEAAINTALKDAERTAAQSMGASYLDFTDYFCGKDSCPAIISKWLVYRDAHHLSASFSEQMFPVVSQHLEKVMP